jgi:FG-GAP repeat
MKNLYIVLIVSLCSSTAAALDQRGASANLPPGAGPSVVAVLAGNISGRSLSASDPGIVPDWQQEAELAGANTLVGFATAVSGDTLVVAAPASPGVVYVFTKSGNKWPLVATLTSSQETNHAFGCAVAISGDTIVVGAYGTNNGIQGAAYVFVKPTSGWKNMHETATLTASDGAPTDSFGFSVAIDGDTAVVGSLHHNENAGAAYVFVKPAGGWKKTMTQTAELVTSDYGGWMGYSLAIADDTIVAGAVEVGPYFGGGAAYIYVEPAKGWANMTQTSKLTASDEGNDLFLGWAVGVSGNTVAASGPGDNDDQGAVYLAVRPKNGWKQNMTETAKLTTRNGFRDYYFGGSLAMSGDTLLAGAPSEDSQTGAAYVFVEPKSGWHTTWNYAARVTASDGQASAQFGYSVGLAGKTALIGSPYFGGQQGAAYVFGQ